jgi:Protein of unknown function (DUF3313)
MDIKHIIAHAKKPVMLIGLCSLTLWLAGCASTQDNISAVDHSGYLSDYSRLQDVSTEEGSLQRWLDSSVTGGNYKKLMIDPVIMFQDGGATLSAEQQAEVDKFSADFDQLLLSSLSGVVEVVAQPGPDVVRVKPAVTSVTTATEGMKAYEVIPIAALIGGSMALAGARDQVIILSLETKLEDSQSGNLVGAAVRKGVADQGDNDKTDADDVKALIRSWAKEGGELVQELF